MILKFKQFLRRTLGKTSWGFRWYYRKDQGVTGPHGMPNANWHNAVLATDRQVEEALQQVRQLGLPAAHDRCKNWDTLAALDVLLRNTNARSPILDAGGERYSMLLPWLALYGYRKLEARNLVFPMTPVRIGPISYRYGDITATDFPDRVFDGIACLSVIEHGVDLHAYFREMARILKPEGVLVTSTDYFESGIDTRNQMAYGVPIHVFTRAEIENAVRIAEGMKFELLSPLDLSSKDRVVRWELYGLHYTFVVFSMRKRSNVAKR